MTRPPLVTIPDSLVHILSNARLMMTPEPRRIVAVHAEGDVLKFELDGPSTLLLTSVVPPIQPTEESKSVEMVAESATSRLLGACVATMRGFSGVVLATWEARREVEDWDVAPVVTFLLVGTESGSHVMERCDVLAP